MGIFSRSDDDGSPQDQVDLDHLRDRVAKLEAAVASLQAQLASGVGGAVAAPGPEPADDEWLVEVRRLKANGQVIPAIKLFREHTESGLKEAKDAVEGMP